ncbi:MAG: hypothetical protein QXN83_01830 [Nitrososphaerales archaeon]
MAFRRLPYVTPELARSLREMKASGYSIRTIAEKMQMPKSTVFHYTRGIRTEPK